MSLSENICENADACYPCHVLRVEDVREAVKQLKEIMCKGELIFNGNYAREIIDQVFGEKLV